MLKAINELMQLEAEMSQQTASHRLHLYGILHMQSLAQEGGVVARTGIFWDEADNSLRRV